MGSRARTRQLRLPLASPATVAELLERARGLQGSTIGDLAARLGTPLSDDPRRSKGAAGMLVEAALGATAGSLDEPDFPRLGVEVKTIPMDRRGRVRESTHVCALDLGRVAHEEWRDSRVRRKLAHVLWIPVEAAGARPLAGREIGAPVLWRLGGEAEATVRADWEAVVGLLATGGVEEVTAHMGRALQVRPKARHGRQRTIAPGPDGEALPTVPLGFYLRARFTEAILWAA